MRGRSYPACRVRLRGLLRGRTEESSPEAARLPSLPARQLRPLILCALLLLCALPAISHAVTIPPDAQRHRATLTREARFRFGMDAPVATFAAQIHQESEWRAGAVSPVGAQGLAQFMPGTARWLPTVMPDTGQPAPFNPAWAIRALVAYDWWILQRVRAATPCDRMAKGLAGYNGGPGWLTRDERKAAAQGLNPDVWWGSVETVNAGRSRAAFRENRGYPRRILLVLEPVYMAAGWGAGSCPAQGGRS
ncbi:transglycosylase SLT domain-containing protein [Nitratidesulfovibrio termitidis]|uniref:transglycosylase SLT domain-containing protein n=1 Tax=Nitratidesulfovibrio termitidis TaxID=42252 RepID=UPI0012EC1E33|nr:transglycosylase SLT domain-containing protein [Nitratidesulfovibrio termitidis]